MTFSRPHAARVRQLHEAMPYLQASKSELEASAIAWDLGRLRAALEVCGALEAEWGAFCAPEVQVAEAGVASLELYRHKRDHPDDPNVSLLEGALDSAKRACRREGA